MVRKQKYLIGRHTFYHMTSLLSCTPCWEEELPSFGQRNTCPGQHLGTSPGCEFRHNHQHNFSVHFLTNEGIHPGTYSSAGNKPQRRLSPRLNSGGITEYRSCITKFRSSVNLKYIVKKLSLWLDLVGELDSFILASLRNWAPWKPQS